MDEKKLKALAAELAKGLKTEPQRILIHITPAHHPYHLTVNIKPVKQGPNARKINQSRQFS
ncbi:hypothetical protein DLR41_27055 [Salmonella enterica subsp. enterica serovar Panama]|nr:hypothetical protein [Salmonella enterica subsp. enterica serovar Panama]ECF2804485.1 hypothetical protein [Salmonella enterica subsp. enterica serovar Miami]